MPRKVTRYCVRNTLTHPPFFTSQKPHALSHISAYCQKIWLWLEEKRLPYRVRKVTMRCYGDKERWFSAIVPSGMLPAVELDGKIITESDDIIAALESTFGPLPNSPPLMSPSIVSTRQMERRLFRAWCSWLCYPSRSALDESRNAVAFAAVARETEVAITSTSGSFFLGNTLTVGDIIFAPYLERMRASLFYYKGYDLCKNHPAIAKWFAAMEQRETYAATMSDCHTHAHDLPPQMGGCYTSNDPHANAAAKKIDQGPFDDATPDTFLVGPPSLASRLEAVSRVVRHRDNLRKVNPYANKGGFDEGLRAALSLLVEGGATHTKPLPPLSRGTGLSLRYIRDRVNVPRDMSIHAARALRSALEEVAFAVDGNGVETQPPPVSLDNRRDQDPRNFEKKN